MSINLDVFSNLKLNNYSTLDFKIDKPNLSEAIEIIEIKKLSDKLKWIERFLKSYSEAVRKLSCEEVMRTKTFVAIYQGIELGYTRIIDATDNYLDRYGKPISRVGETYVKPRYRGQGVCTSLRRYVKQNENVMFLRIKINRFIENRFYFENEGFYYLYKEEEKGDMCVIGTLDFLDILNNKVKN